MSSDGLQNAFTRRDAARARLGGISNATLHRWVNEGKLPRLVKIGPRCSGFVTAELDAAIEARIAARVADAQAA